MKPQKLQNQQKVIFATEAFVNIKYKDINNK